MSDCPLKYLRNESIDEATACRFRQCEAATGEVVVLPLLIEQIVEWAFGLDSG